MNKLRKYIVVFLVQCLCIVAAFSQETMRINGTQIVKKGETLTIDAGRIVEFEAGATLIVEGSVVVRGTIDNPVIMKSMDLQNPGNGIMVKDIDENGSVVMDNVRISGLIQPLRFDPFWYRKNVDLKSMVISAANSGEPVIYVAGPLLDLRERMDIRFSMNSLKFYNNSGSVLLEKVGSDGIVYDLDKLLFSDNTLPGSDVTMGVLHLDIARSVSEGQFKLGELAFNRNFSGDKSVGVSMSGGNGTGAEKFEAQGVFGNDNVSDLIYDRRANVRIPSLEVKNMAGLDKYSDEKNFIVSSNHVFGKVQIKVIGNPTIVKLEDSMGKPVYNNALRKGDTLELNYLEGNPTVVTLSNGEKFKVPKLSVSQLPPPIYRRVDTTLISPVWPDTTKTGVGGGRLSLRISIPTGGDLSYLDSSKAWEVGQWFGGAIYGGGDIRHKFFPLPSTMEYSYGIYLQRNYRKLSWSTDYNYCKISMHNFWAPGLFSGGEVNYINNTAGQKIKPFPNSWALMFITPMHSIGVNGIWHLGRNELPVGDKGKWVNSIGIGLGFIYFNPMRIPWLTPTGFDVKTGRYNDTLMNDGVRTENAQQWKNRVFENKINLRRFGSEGQNFILGANRYSPITTYGSVEYRLTYLRKKWNFKMSMKATIAASDYLDDCGPGVIYGGDRDKMIEYGVNELQYSRSTLESAFPKLPDNALSSSTKSINGLPDGFMQMHMGISYYFTN